MPASSQSKSRSGRQLLTALRLLLPLCILVVVASQPTPSSAAQIPFIDTRRESNETQRSGLSAHTYEVPDDDPAPVPAIRLSHQGLYINRPHSPTHHPHPSLALNASQVDLARAQSGGRPPPQLVLHLDTDAYKPETARIRLGPIRVRSRDQVMLECGTETGGIESCEQDDLDDEDTRAETSASGQQDAIECRFDDAGEASTGGHLVLGPRNCPGWHRYWSGQPRAAKHDGEETLTSLVVSSTVEAASTDDGLSTPHRASAHTTTERWWIGELHLDESRASWPLAGNARARRPGTSDRVWHPDNVNRISGSMENPLIPKTSRNDPADPQQGVYVEQSSWSLGVQIRIPLGITSSQPDNATTALLMPPEEVFAPVAGQVVWSRPYLRRRPPLVGEGAGQNDEWEHCIMVRDEWSIVYQLFGLDSSTISVKEGDDVARGDVLGHALREGLSSMPPSTAPPTDHPDSKDDRSVRYYPYRYRKLEVRVSRPHRDWTEWKDPDELGWQYFQPLHVFREGRIGAGESDDNEEAATAAKRGRKYRSTVPPYGSPTTMFFARPLSDPLNAPPVAFASSDDFFTPTLSSSSGKVEIYAGFESFQSTPGDAADGMEPLALYAMDLGVRKKVDGERAPDREDACDLGGDGGEEEGVETWRTMWEHSKIPNAWTSPFSTRSDAAVRWHSKLFAHYLPSFSYGSWFPTRYTSEFDEKTRRLFYVVGRQVRGEPKLVSSSSPSSVDAVAPLGGGGGDGAGLDVQADLMRGRGQGRYIVALRARDYWGNTGCVRSEVYLS